MPYELLLSNRKNLFALKSGDRSEKLAHYFYKVVLKIAFVELLLVQSSYQRLMKTDF